jgi:hypothetical protein
MTAIGSAAALPLTFDSGSGIRITPRILYQENPR